MAKVIDRTAQAEVEVSASEAQRGILQGKYDATPGRLKVQFRGKLVTVPSEKAHKYLSNGARIVDDEEARELLIRKEESDLPSQALGAAESALSGVTLGGSRVVEEALGVDAERMAARESDTAEIIGGIVPGLATGGAGFGAAAAKAVGGAAVKRGALRTALSYTPAGIVTRGGNQVASKVAGAVGAQGFRRAVPVAAGQFVEGIGFATGSEIDEAVLGKREVAVENILAGGVLSSALGGAFGGTAGLLTRGANRTAQKALRGTSKGLSVGDEVLKSGDETLAAAQDILQRHLGDASTGAATAKMPDWAVKGVSMTSGMPVDDIRGLERMVGSAEGRAHLGMTKHDRATSTFALSREIDRTVTPLNDAVVDALKHSEGVNLTKGLGLDFGTVDAQRAAVALEDVLKPGQAELAAAMREIGEVTANARSTARVRGSLRRQRDDMMASGQDDLVDAADEVLEPMEAIPSFGASPHSLDLGRKLREAYNIAEETRAMAATERLLGRNAGSSFEMFDQSQRRLGAIRREMTGMIDEARSRQKGVLPYDMRALQAVTDIHEGLRARLYDENLWPVAGPALKARDMRQAAAIAARERAGRLSPAVKRVLKMTDEPVLSDDLLGVARRLGRHNGAEDAIDTVFDTELAYLSELDGLDATLTAKIAKARAAREKFTQVVKSRRQELDDLDLMDRARATMGNDSPSVGVQSTLGAVMGGAFGGPIGGVIGVALTSPLMVAKALANLKRLSNVSGVRVDTAVGKALSVARAGASRGANKARGYIGDAREAAVGARRKLIAADRQDAPWQRSLIGRVSDSRNTQLGVSATTRQERREESERTRELVAYYASRPGQLFDDVTRSAGIASDHAPYLIDALGLQSEKAVEFLQSKMPESYAAPFSPRAPKVNPVAEAKWQRYVMAVTRPLDALDLLAEGRFSSEHAEAIQAVYPEIYLSVRASFMDEMALAAEEGRSIPLRMRMQMGVLLNLPTNVALTPEGFSAIQAIYREERNQKRAPTRTGSGSSTNKNTGLAATPAGQTEI